MRVISLPLPHVKTGDQVSVEVDVLTVGLVLFTLTLTLVCACWLLAIRAETFRLQVGSGRLQEATLKLDQETAQIQMENLRQYHYPSIKAAADAQGLTIDGERIEWIEK